MYLEIYENIYKKIYKRIYNKYETIQEIFKRSKDSQEIIKRLLVG